MSIHTLIIRRWCQSANDHRNRSSEVHFPWGQRHTHSGPDSCPGMRKIVSRLQPSLLYTCALPAQRFSHIFQGLTHFLAFR